MSSQVRVDPIPEANLVEPSNGDRTDQDSDEESDNDYEEWQMNEPAFKVHTPLSVAVNNLILGNKWIRPT